MKVQLKLFKALNNLRLRYHHFLVPASISAFPIAFGLFFYSISKRKQRLKSPKLAFQDPEFSGFSLVKCSSPYLPETSQHTEKFCILPVDLADGSYIARSVLDDTLDPCDVVVASYPKSGTTWVSEVVYLLVNDLDWNKAASSNLEERVPYMEYIWPGAQAIAKRSSPRIIKTHLPFDHLPEAIQRGRAARIIYITRDPRDTVVSYYHFALNFLPAGYRNHEGLDGFVNRFLEDRLPYSPWTNHVQGYLKAAASYSTEKTSESHQAKMSPKVLIITYEMLKSDMELVVRTIEQFLHETWSTETNGPIAPKLLTSEDMRKLCQHCSFENMSKNPSTNFAWMKNLGIWSDEHKTRFMRQGVVGNHRQWLKPEQSKRIAKKAIDAGLNWTLRS